MLILGHPEAVYLTPPAKSTRRDGYVFLSFVDDRETLRDARQLRDRARSNDTPRYDLSNRIRAVPVALHAAGENCVGLVVATLGVRRKLRAAADLLPMLAELRGAGSCPMAEQRDEPFTIR